MTRASSLLGLALLAVASCTTFTGTFDPDTADDGKLPGGFGPGAGEKDGVGSDIPATPACTEAVCWTLLDASAGDPAIDAPICNPSGVGDGCPGGFGCSAAPITVLAQGSMPAHPALACTAIQPGASTVVVDVAGQPTAAPDAVQVDLTVRLAGAPLPETAGETGELWLTSRATGRVWRAPLGQSGDGLAPVLPPGSYDARLTFGDRLASEAPPLPVHGVVEIREAGSATIDLPVATNTVRILINRGTIEPGRLGGSRGVLVVRSASGDEARAALPNDGAGEGVSVVLVPGAYDLSYDASSAEALLVPRQHVPLGQGVTLSGSTIELELETATMFVGATIDGKAAPGDSLVVLDTGLEPAKEFALSDGGALMFAVPTDVILEVPPGGELPAGSTRLAEGHVPTNDETLAVDVETTPLLGELTVNGEPLGDIAAGTTGRLELRATGRAPSSVPLLFKGGKFGGPVYRDPGELWYVPGAPLSKARPMQEVRLATGFDPTGTTETFDIEAAQVAVRVLLAGAEPPEAGEQAARGTLTLRPTGTDPGLGPLVAALPLSGEAVVTMPVAFGEYDVAVQLLPGDPSQPPMPGITSANESFAGDRELLADVRPATLAATLVTGGKPFDAIPVPGGRGSLRFVSARGEQLDVTLESVGEARATALLYEGAWSIYYVCEGPCQSPLAPVWPAPLVEGIGASAP